MMNINADAAVEGYVYNNNMDLEDMRITHLVDINNSFADRI